MTAKNLSAVATDLIESYGNTAKNVIDAYRVGGERVVSLLEQRWDRALKQSRSELAAETAKNASAAQMVLSIYYSKGLDLATNGATHAVSGLVKALEQSVERVAANASAFEEKTGVTTLNTLATAAAPGALVLSNLVSQIEQKTAALASKIAGDDVDTASVRRKSAFGKRRAAKAA